MIAKFFVGRFDPDDLRRLAKYGCARAELVHEALDSVHMGVAICALPPSGRTGSHVHAFEQGFLFPVSVEHCWHTVGHETARWFEMVAPRPTPLHTVVLDGRCSAAHEPVRPDLLDPRTRYLGHLDIAEALPSAAASGGRNSNVQGVSIRPMLDAQIGAESLTLFLGQLAVGAQIRLHDHPFEEFQFFLDGTAEVVLDGGAHRQALQPGDFVWTRVGISHAFINTGSTPLRWLETQAPQPPRQYQYRFVRDWEGFKQRAAGQA